MKTLLLFTLLFGLFGPSAQAQFDWPPTDIPRRADPCTLTTHQSTLITQQVAIPGYGESPGMDIYAEKSVVLGLPGTVPVVLIINGNGRVKEQYAVYAEFLARNGFVVGVAEREAASTDPLFPLNALYSVFAVMDIDQDSPVALLGHSKGGYVVNEAARANVSMGLDLNIKSVINVAPNIDGSELATGELSGPLNGYHTRSFLSLWGSRDHDMRGQTGMPREGIAAYDQVGTESSTTCGSPPCYVHPQNLIEKVSVYVNGADHDQFLNAQSQTSSIGNYLSNSDQYCIGKAYTHAFLRKHLMGITQFDRFLRNEKLPPSLSVMTTSWDDGTGEPVGSDVRLYHQYSPVQKRSIENFNDNHYQLWGSSAHVVDFIVAENSNTEAPFFIRHLTDSLLVAWESKNANQYIGFAIPAWAENASTFTHLSLRVGLLKDMPYPMYANGHEDKTFRIGLRDQNYVSRYEYRTVGRPDRHTTMQTVMIPLNAFNGLDLRELQMVYLSFDPNTQGTLILDNIEFIRQ